jgi:di/tricarboxylate transporter
MEVSPDPFLIAVAIGASADFLTPFGHHNNTIILGPGGYRFSDFWRVGLGACPRIEIRLDNKVLW